MKKIIIAGGTGFLGQILAQYFKDKYQEIIILTRKEKPDNDNIKYIIWDGKTKDKWFSYLEGADVLINLTGRSVDCRYNEKNKATILNSRVDATEILGHAVRMCDAPPKVWLNSSTATIYRHSMDKEMDGGKQGNGNQYFSWLHEDDFSRAIHFLIDKEELEGIFNLVAPKPTTNTILMSTIRQLLKIPFGIPLPKWLLEIGANMIRTETELVLKSRRVVPKRLIDNGFSFKYMSLTKSLNHLIYFK